MDVRGALSDPDRMPAIARALEASLAPFSLVHRAAELLPAGIPEVPFNHFAMADAISGDLEAWFCSEAIEVIEAHGWALCVDFGDGPVVWTRPADFSALTH